MNWRKNITLTFVPLLVFLGITLTDKRSEKKERKPHLARSPARADQTEELRKKDLKPKVLAHISPKANNNSFLRNRIPQSLESTFHKDENIKVTKGHEFLTDVAAVPSKDYREDMGPLILEKEGFVYFKSSPGHGFVSVAISKSTNNLYPISSVLHIKNVTPELRSTLLAQGYSEYYYHQPLKFLSLKSKHSDLLKTYLELRQQGYNVELEVLKPQHKTI